MYKIHIVNESGETELLMPFEGNVLTIAKGILTPNGKTPDIDWGVVVDGIINEKLAGVWDELELVAKNLQKLLEASDQSDLVIGVVNMVSELEKQLNALEAWANVHAKDERELAAKEEVKKPTLGVETVPDFRPGKTSKRRYHMKDGKRVRSAKTQAIYDKYPSANLTKDQYGKYCRFCGKELDGTKPIFCNRSHAAKWRTQHKGQLATPRYTLEPAAFTHKVTPGVGVESPDYAPTP